MEKNNLQKLDNKNGEKPMEKTLCVFRRDNLFILGYISSTDRGDIINEYGRERTFNPEDFYEFQYVLNNRDGFIFL